MKAITITFNADTEGAAAKMASLLKGVNGGLNELSGMVARIAPQLAAVFTLGGFIKLGENALHTADAMNKLAQKTGIATETLSAYAYSARLADVSQEEMGLGLKTLATQIANAAQGGAEAAQSFLRAGVEFKNSDGSMRSLEGVVESLADRFQKMPDGVNKTDAAVALLGRAGQSMIPWLNAGAEGLRKMKEEALAMGLVIKGDTAQRAEELNDNLTRLKLILEGVFLRLADNLLPTLVDWGNQIAQSIRDHGEFGKVIEFVADIIRGLGVEVMLVRTVFVTLGRLLGDSAGLGFEVLLDGIKTILREFELWFDTVKTMVSGLFTLGKTVADVGNIMSHVMKGEWSAAWEAGKEKVGAVQEVLSQMGSHLADNVNAATGAVVAFADRSWEGIKTVGSDAIKDIKAEWVQFADKALEPFMGKRPAMENRARGGSESTVDLKAQQDLLDNINKGYADAFLSRKQLLENEYELNLARIKREVKDEEEKEAAITALTLTYQKKRADIERDHAVMQSSLELQRAQLAQSLIERDPTKSETEKKRELIPLLKAQNALVEQQIELYRQIAEDNVGRSEDERIEATRQLVELEGQRAEIAQKQRDNKQPGFKDTFEKGINRLGDEWGNVGFNLAQTGLKAVEDGVQGVSDAIMGAIEGTKSWGQVFSQIARSIIASIIQVVVQWIASMTIIAALKAIFGIKDKAAAEASSESWAPAAIAASIASYGGAAVAGLTGYIAAISAGTAVTGALSLGSKGFKVGGLISGPEQLVRVNEEGQEFVFSAPATRKALPFLEQLHASLQAGHDLATSIHHALPSPFTSEGAGFAQASSGSTVNVSPAPLHLAILNDESQYRRFLESKAGKRVMVRNLSQEDRSHPR